MIVSLMGVIPDYESSCKAVIGGGHFLNVYLHNQNNEPGPISKSFRWDSLKVSAVMVPKVHGLWSVFVTKSHL